jgi:hypothetical protein
MHKIFFLIALLSFNLLSNAQTSPWEWAISVNGPSPEDEIDAVTSDHLSNVYVSGKFEDSIYVTGYPFPVISAGQADIMIVKYDSTGIFQWIKKIGGTGEDNVFDAVCNQSGELIISGYFQNTIQIDTITLTSYGGFDAFLAKLDTNGNVIWALQYGGISDDGGNEVTVANNGQLLVSAQSIGNITIGAFSFSNTNPGIDDAYIISVNPNGTVQWVRTVAGLGNARAKSVAVDNSGNVYFGGDFIGPNSIPS